MASFTALMNVVVDATEASKGLNTLDNRLTKIQKSSKTTSSSLSRLEKTFDKIEKSIKSVVAPIQKMESNLNKLVGKSMSGYLRIVQRLQKDNFKLKTSIKAVNDQINILNSDITKLNQKIDALEKRLNKLGGTNTKTKIGGLAEAFKALGKAIQRNEYLFYSLASGVLNFIKINLIGALIRITDQYVLMENRIRLVNSSQVAFNNNMAAVKQIAQETRQSLYAIANLYSRVGRNSKELGKDTIALATTVSTIAKSFQIAGATAEEARNAIVQLSQALASGRLQGDELRSILELAPTLANSIAKSIGITLGSLRSFASEGLITTSIITKAVRESAQEIDEEFKKIVPTISQSMTNIQNAFQIVLGETKEIKEANEIAALSFLNLAKNIEKLAGSPAMTKLGELLKSIALSISDVIIGLTAFIALIGTATVIGVLAALFGGLAPAILIVASAFAGATASISYFQQATENLAIPIRGVDEVIKDVNKSLEDNAKKTGDSVTESEKAAAQFSALKTESYEAGLQIDLFNRKLATLNEELNNLKAQTEEDGFFTKWSRRFLNDAFAIGQAYELFGGGNLGDMIFGPEKEPRIKELEKEIERLNKVIQDGVDGQKKIDDEIKKRRDAQAKDAITAEEEFVRNFLNTTERTNRRLAARFQEVRDAFQDSLSQPFEIRFTPAKKALAELNDTLRQKIGDIGEKRAKGSQLEFGGVGLDIKTLRDLALGGQQLTAANLGIKDAIASMLAGNKAVQDAGTAIPQVLLAEIEAATNEELLKFQEKVLEVEKQMAASLAQRKKDQQRLNEDMASANRFASNELKYLKDGVKLHENKVAAINAEYNYKVLNLKEDLRGLGYLDEEIEKLTEALEKERLLAIEAERIAKAKSDLLYIESELDKLRNTQFQLNMADKEYELLQKYNSEYDRRKMLRQEERRLLLDMKKIEWEMQGLQGERLKQAQEIFETQLNTEDSLRRQQLLLESGKRTERARIDLEAKEKAGFSERRNEFAIKNRLDAFLVQGRKPALDAYNNAMIDAIQQEGLSVDYLKENKNVKSQLGLSMLELPDKIDGVDKDILDNLKKREEYLRRILGLEEDIVKVKGEDQSFWEQLGDIFPNLKVEGTAENKFAQGVSTALKTFSEKQEIKDILAASKLEDAAITASKSQMAGLGGVIPGGEAAGGLLEGLGGMFGDLGSMFGDAFAAFGDILSVGFDMIFDAVTNVAGILIKILMATITNDKFLEGFQKITDSFNGIFDSIGDGLAQIFQGLFALLEPFTYVFDIIGGFFRGFLRSFTRVIEPIGKLFESLQPVFITIGAALQSFLLIFNQIFSFVGKLIDQITEFIGGSTEDGYKSLVLLKAERDVLQEIESSLEGVVDVLRQIEDVLFDIVNSSLNLAAPSIKLENAAEKYDELFTAASRFGADEEAVNAFTSFAKEFLQQSQDVLKSSTAYQQIYDNVIKDIMSISDNFVEGLGSDVTETLQKGVFDLKIVGSDLADAIDNIVDKYREGAISFTTVADYMSYKLGQIEDDIALRDVAEFGAIDIGAEFERFAQMRGAAISSSSLEEDLAALTGQTSNLTSAVLEAYAASDATTEVSTIGRSATRVIVVDDVSQPSGYQSTGEAESPFDLFAIDGMKLIEDLAQWIIDAIVHALEQIWGTFADFLSFITEPLTRITDGTFAKWVEELFSETFGLLTDGTFAKFVEELFGGLFSLFTDSGFGEFLEELFGGMFEKMGDLATGDFLTSLMQPIADLTADIGDWVDAAIVKPLADMGSLDIADWIENILLKPLQSLTVGLIDYFTAVLYPIFNIGNIDFGDYIGMVLYPLYGLVVDAWDFVQALFDPIFNMGGLDTGDFLANILKPIADLSTDFATFIQKLFDTVFDGMGVDPAKFIEVLLSPFDGIKGTLEDILGILGDPFTNLSGTIESLLNIIKAPFSNLNGTIESILGIISKPFQSLSGSVTSLVNIIKAPFENLTGTISSIVDVLKEPFKGIQGSAQVLLDLITDALNFPNVTYDLLGAVTDALKGLFGIPDDAGIKLLYNPFKQFGIGPEYFLEFAKGGQVPSTPVGDGGYIFGPSHSQGGIPGVIPSSHGDIPIEMEGGEYIINKKATKNIGLAALNELNSLSGNANIPSSILSFENGGTTTNVKGTKHVPDQSAINNLAGKNGGGFTKNSFSILKFSGETGGTIRDVIGHHGIDIDLRIPDLIEKGKSNPAHFVKYFEGGGGTPHGWSSLSPDEKKKVEAISTDQFNGNNSDTIYKPFNRFGNDVLGRVSLEVGAKDRMTKPVFNGKYEPPPWVPEWVKDAIEQTGEAIVDAISDPVGFVENIAEQVGAVITEITEAIGTAVSEVFNSIGLGGVSNALGLGGGGGGGGSSPYGVYDAFADAIEEFWYPDDAQAVTMISSLLNLDMLQSDISEIQSNVSNLLLEWTDFSMGFGDAQSNSSSYLEYLFKDYIYTGLSTPDAAGGINEFLDVLANQIIGGTATRKAFQHEQRVFDPISFDMNTPVPRIQYGKMPNPFLGQNQDTRPSGRQGYLWDALNLYGRYDSKNERIIPNWGFIDGTSVVSFMGGMDNVNKTGIFAQLFGRSSAEGYDGRNVFSDYRGGSASDLAAMGIENGKNYNQLFRDNTSGDVRDYDNAFAKRMQKLAATLYTFITRQFSASSVLNLDFNRLKFAPQGGGSTDGGRSDVEGMTSDGMGFYATGGYVSGLSHANGGVIAELEDGEFVIKKSAVDAIGIDTLNRINSGSGGLFTIPKFQEGGAVVGRRDYDPLLAQAITEQYRNADLEGGTYEQVQSIYESLQGTGLNSDLGAALTQIFGTPEGFFDQINFEGITESGITNSIIDGISDVFDSQGEGGGSYPVTVVSEPMYLDYMTRPLNAVIVTAGNYMDYISEPLPNRVYQTDYLAVMALPLDGIGDGIQPANFLDRILSPLDDVVINSATLSEALSKVVDRIVIDNAMFNYSFISKLMEMLASDDSSTVEIIDSIDKLYTKVENYFDDLISTQEEVINTQLTKIIELGEELSRITAYYEDIIAEKDEVIKSQSAELTKLEKSLNETKDSLVNALNAITAVEEDLAKTQQELADTLKKLKEANTVNTTPDPYDDGGTTTGTGGGGGGGGGTPTPTPTPTKDTPKKESEDEYSAPFPMSIFQAIFKAIESFFGGGSIGTSFFDITGFQTEIDGFINSFETGFSGLLGTVGNVWDGSMSLLGMNGSTSINGLSSGMNFDMSNSFTDLEEAFGRNMNNFELSGSLESLLFGNGLGSKLSNTLTNLSTQATSWFNNFELSGSFDISSFAMSITTNFKGTLDRLGKNAQNFLDSITGGGGGGGGGFDLFNPSTWGKGGLLEFQNGGMATGPSHQSGMLGLTRGGTPFLFEGGEYIINKKSTNSLGVNLLDSLNSYSGGGYISARRKHDFAVATGKKPANSPPPDPYDPEFIGTNLSVIEYGSDAWKRQESNRLKKEREERKKLNAQMALMEEKRKEANTQMDAIREGLMVQSKNMLDNLVKSQSGISDTLVSDAQQTTDSLYRTGLIFSDLTYFGDESVSTTDPLVARRDVPSSGISGGTSISQFSDSLRSGIDVGNDLLVQLITTVRDKDLSVTIVDSSGNEVDQTSLLIARQEQLQYRGATELV